MWIFGDNLTVVDFCFAETIERILMMEEELNLSVVSQMTNLNAYSQRFFALDRINSFRNSSKFMKRPFNNKQAAWK